MIYLKRESHRFKPTREVVSEEHNNVMSFCSHYRHTRRLSCSLHRMTMEGIFSKFYSSDYVCCCCWPLGNSREEEMAKEGQRKTGQDFPLFTASLSSQFSGEYKRTKRLMETALSSCLSCLLARVRTSHLTRVNEWLVEYKCYVRRSRMTIFRRHHITLLHMAMCVYSRVQESAAV